jgi:Ca-activated chloride channel homolog
MRRSASGLMALAALVLLWLFGAPFAARLGYLAGFPRLTLALTDDPGARGAALYLTGRPAEADAVFADIGRGATYDRAATLALTGNYPLAVAYYDAVLFADRWDAEARHNREVVAGLVDPVIGEAMGHGRIDALLVEVGVKVAGFEKEDPAGPAVFPNEAIRKPLDAGAVVADADWLDTLADAPGEYLTKRLAAEYERRRAEGLDQLPEASPW